MRVEFEGREFSLLSDAELDDTVRNIRAVTPEAGLLMVQGWLRLIVQRVRVMHSLGRVDPVTSALRNARRIIRRSYNVPSPNSLIAKQLVRRRISVRSARHVCCDSSWPYKVSQNLDIRVESILSYSSKRRKKKEFTSIARG